MPGAFALQPLTIIEILDRAFAVYRSRFFTFFAVLAVIYVPVNMGLVVFEATHPETFTSEDPKQALRLTFLQGAIDAIIYGLAFSIATGATTRAVGDLYAGERVSFRRSYGALLRIFPRYLATTILSDLVCTFGFFLCLIPGFIFNVMFAFSPSVCVLEDRWGPLAMARSRELGRDHGGRIFGLFLLAGILIVVAGVSADQACESFLPDFISNEANLLYVTNAVSTVITLFLTPYFSIAWVLLYYDLRIRKEAFDLEVLTRALAVPPSPKG